VPAQTPSRPIGAHVPVTGGLAAGGLAAGGLAAGGLRYTAETIATLKALRGKGRAARTQAAAMR
jgi:hypothetical protein